MVLLVREHQNKFIICWDQAKKMLCSLLLMLSMEHLIKLWPPRIKLWNVACVHCCPAKWTASVKRDIWFEISQDQNQLRHLSEAVRKEWTKEWVNQLYLYCFISSRNKPYSLWLMCALVHVKVKQHFSLNLLYFKGYLMETSLQVIYP